MMAVDSVADFLSVIDFFNFFWTSLLVPHAQERTADDQEQPPRLASVLGSARLQENHREEPPCGDENR